MHHLGGRRLIAARFRSGVDAETARAMLESRLPSASEAGVSIAPMADGGAATAAQPLIVVARVAHGEYLPAERLIADLGGQVVYEADESSR